MVRLLVLGAGVIGQVYAGRLAAAGNDVTVAARGSTLAALARNGIRIRRGGQLEAVRVAVVDAGCITGSFDAVLFAVRADQAEAALATVYDVDAPAVATLANLVGVTETAAQRIGRQRLVLGFPGVGGTRGADGVEYHQIARQPTTIEQCAGREKPMVEALRTAGLPVATVADMPSWLATHTVFVTGVGSAILAVDGDCDRLAADRGRVKGMVRAVGDGFHALAASGTTVQPAALNIIFTRVPRWISVPYWARLIRSDTGRVAIAPHVLATRGTEFAFLVAAVRRLLGERMPPSLATLLVDDG